MFADDLVFYSTCKNSIQRALDVLSLYCKTNNMEVNLSKTKVLKFRRGGKAKEVFRYNDNIVEHCSSYEYLGVTLQPTWNFTIHLKKKRIKANSASYRIKDLQLLSLEGAQKYFSVMILPIVAYGIDIIWYDFNIKHFELLDCCWFDYYKKVLAVPKCTRNRKVAILVGLPLLSESLVKSGRVKVTSAYKQYLNKLENKFVDVDPDFFETPALNQSSWKNGYNKKRHLVTRLAVHGFHHKMCKSVNCFKPDLNCLCKFCNTPCKSLNHAIVCPFMSDKGLNYLDDL